MFTAPSSVPFRRVVKGGSGDDRFFVMFQFLGNGIRFVGGTIDGNLAARPFERGPRPAGFGGADFGIVCEGEGWALENVVIRNWGTDCVLAMASGRASNCTFERARRNGMSVVAAAVIPESRPLIVENCRFLGNGDWPDDMYNNPASGLDVEAGSPSFPATVIVRDNEFRGNKLKDLQLSKDATNCIVTGNTFNHDLRLRPMQKGGHTIERNEFRGEASILATTTARDSKPVKVRQNTRNGRAETEISLVRHTRSRVFGADAEQSIID